MRYHVVKEVSKVQKDIKAVFSNNLVRLMEERDFNVQEVANRTNIAYSTVNDWTHGKKMARSGGLQKLANLFNVNISELITEKQVIGLEEVVSMTKIPVIGTIACGEPILADENIEEYREEPSARLPTGELFYLRTKGDSMTPTIPEGSYVLIRVQSDVEDGEIIVDNRHTKQKKDPPPIKVEGLCNEITNDYEIVCLVVLV